MTLRRATATNRNGLIILDDPETGIVEIDTLQCVHCGLEFPHCPGSGKIRGFCTRCNGPTCGCAKCGECVPMEAQLEILEGTRNPTAVTVCGGMRLGVIDKVVK